MKRTFLTFAVLALSLGAMVHPERADAYSSNAGADPDRTGIGNGSSAVFSNDIETKAIKKSNAAGSSEALIAGLIVGYDAVAVDGYTVTRAVPQTLVGLNTLACVTTDTVATNDLQYHRCITKGFAMVRYDGTGTNAGIVAGRPACVNASGLLVGCKEGDALQSTINTGITPLKSATDSGSALPVLLDLQ